MRHSKSRYTWGLIDAGTGRTYLFNMNEIEAKRIAKHHTEFLAVPISQKLHPIRDVFKGRLTRKEMS